MADTGIAPRERILSTAYDLFSHRGIRDVGINEVIKRSGVAKATLYKHFSSKDDLVRAFLELRERRWTLEFMDAQARARGTTPEQRLLAIFDVLGDWFASEDFDACSFVNVLLEMRPDHPPGQASIQHLENVRSVVAQLATEAALHDVPAFAHSWHLLMNGSIIAAVEGDRHAAHRAQAMARQLIAQHRP